MGWNKKEVRRPWHCIAGEGSLRHTLSIIGKNNFEKAIKRSMDSCETAGITVPDHFREVTKMVQLGSGSQRAVKDYMLTRYA